MTNPPAPKNSKPMPKHQFVASKLDPTNHFTPESVAAEVENSQMGRGATDERKEHQKYIKALKELATYHRSLR